MLKVGDKVPVFSLMDTERNEFTNANIEGKITLFLFFPAAVYKHMHHRALFS